MPLYKSQVYKQLLKIKHHAKRYEMKMIIKKTKKMLFNPCNLLDFTPSYSLDNHQLEVEGELKLLGIHIRSDMKCQSNKY